MKKVQNIMLVMACVLLFGGCTAKKNKENTSGVEKEKRDTLIVSTANEPDKGFDPIVSWGGR